MKLLTQDAVTTLTLRDPTWSLVDGKLTRQWSFGNFVDAIAFVNAVALYAEEVGHHPDIDVRYGDVRLSLTTHDAGGVTLLDAEMAAYLSRTYKGVGSTGSGRS